MSCLALRLVKNNKIQNCLWYNFFFINEGDEGGEEKGGKLRGRD